MFCSNCGNRIADGSLFCPSCGMPTGIGSPDSQISSRTSPFDNNASDMPSYYDHVGSRKSQRQAECNELERMISYFSQKSAEYAEYDRLSLRLNPKYSVKRVGMLVWGIIGFVFGLLLILLPLDMIWLGVVSSLGGAALIIGYIFSSRARRENYDAALSRFIQVSSILEAHYRNYANCMVSAEYTNPYNLRVILDTIKSGRADTIKEAINILIEDSHKKNMADLARKTAYYSAQTAASAAKAARGARVSAVFNVAGFFLK